MLLLWPKGFQHFKISWTCVSSRRGQWICFAFEINVLKVLLPTPEFFLMLCRNGFTVTQMGYRRNPRSNENSAPMSISALVVAFVTFVFGLCFVYLWRHLSKTQDQGTTQPRSKQTKTEAEIASSHWCRKWWYTSNQLETTIRERYNTCYREAGLI